MAKRNGAEDGKLNEKEAKEKLGVNSWDELSKDKHVEFIEILPRLNKDALLHISEYIPDILDLANTLVETVRSVAEKAIEKDRETTKAMIEALNAIQSSLSDLTKREDLSSEDLRYVCGEMVEIAKIHERMNKVNKEHSEKKWQYIGDIAGKALAVIGVIVIAILGGKDNDSDYRG